MLNEIEARLPMYEKARNHAFSNVPEIADAIQNAPTDIGWLIERVKELEKKVDFKNKVIGSLSDEIVALKGRQCSEKNCPHKNFWND